MSPQLKIAIVAGILWWVFRIATIKLHDQGNKEASKLGAVVTLFFFLIFAVSGLWGLFLL